MYRHEKLRPSIRCHRRSRPCRHDVMGRTVDLLGPPGADARFGSHPGAAPPPTRRTSAPRATMRLRRCRSRRRYSVRPWLRRGTRATPQQPVREGKEQQVREYYSQLHDRYVVLLRHPRVEIGLERIDLIDIRAPFAENALWLVRGQYRSSPRDNASSSSSSTVRFLLGSIAQWVLRGLGISAEMPRTGRLGRVRTPVGRTEVFVGTRVA